MSCFYDIAEIPDVLESDIKLVGGELLGSYYNKMKKIPSSFIAEVFKLTPTKGLIRKLSVINDPEGKARIIAILDYWSQTALKPLHEKLFSMLGKIKADCTFNQTSPRTLKRGPYYSLDLTAATDRFPVKTQVAILAAATKDREYAEA